MRSVLKTHSDMYYFKYCHISCKNFGNQSWNQYRATMTKFTKTINSAQRAKSTQLALDQLIFEFDLFLKNVIITDFSLKVKLWKSFPQIKHDFPYQQIMNLNYVWKLQIMQYKRGSTDHGARKRASNMLRFEYVQTRCATFATNDRMVYK